MELRSYFSLLWRRKLVLILTTTIVVAVVAFGSRRMVAQYAATATLWVPASRGDSVGSGDILLNDRLINTYAELSTSRPVLLELEQRLGVASREIKERIRAGSVAQTELLQITVLHENPQFAAEAATNIAEIVIGQTQRTDAGRTLRVSLFTAAGVPTTPTWMGLLPTPYWREINIILAAVIGLIGGIALAFLFEYLDSSLRTSKEITSVAQLPLIGEIPVARKIDEYALLNGNTLQGEAFRYLRTNLFPDAQSDPCVLLITSATPDAGKSSITANLAVAIARAGRKVIVADADLRLPSQQAIFQLSNEVGLSQVLTGEITVDAALRQSAIPGVQVMTSGPSSERPAELLDSPRMRMALEQLRERADVTLLDSPAVLAVTDAIVLSPLVDGVLLVVDRRAAQQEVVESVREQLDAVNADLVGIVVNRVKQTADHYYHDMVAASKNRAKTIARGSRR